MRIACDMDGVVCKWAERFIQYLNIRFNKAIAKEELTDWKWWNVIDELSEEEFTRAFKEFTFHRRWTTIDMYEDASDVLCSLTSMGHHIYYLTDRPEEARRDTLKYITGKGLTIDSVIFCKGSQKASIAKELEVDIAIDDKIETIRDYKEAGIMSVLRRQPYNEKFGWKPECRSLKRFKHIIEEIDNGKK